MKTKAATEPSSGQVPEAFNLDGFLPHQLSVTTSRVSRMFARHYADRFGLTIPEWRVLAVIGQKGVSSPTAVGASSAMDKVKVSRAAASLVARGLVRQVPDPSDGRGRLLSLTRKGAAIHGGAMPLARDLEATLADGLTRAEWAALNKALVKLSAHVGAIDGPGHAAVD